MSTFEVILLSLSVGQSFLIYGLLVKTSSIDYNFTQMCRYIIVKDGLAKEMMESLKNNNKSNGEKNSAA